MNTLKTTDPADRNFWDRAFETVVKLVYDGGGTVVRLGVSIKGR